MIPESLIDLIRRFEGLRLAPYLCPAGVPTVGYGHTGPGITLATPPISEAVADGYLYQDAAYFLAQSARFSPTLLAHPERHAAIADFCFNLGAARYKASTLKRRIDAGNWLGAAEELQKWVWGGGRKLPGLVARRAAEANLLLG